MLRITAEENASLLPVKIVPGASQTRYLGPWAGRARIAVAAPPEKGKANRALVEFLAGVLGVRKGCIAVVRGAASAQKTVRVEGITPAALAEALRRLSAEA